MIPEAGNTAKRKNNFATMADKDMANWPEVDR